LAVSHGQQALNQRLCFKPDDRKASGFFIGFIHSTHVRPRPAIFAHRKNRCGDRGCPCHAQCAENPGARPARWRTAYSPESTAGGGEKANQELVAWLARELKVPRASIELIRGDAARRKQLRVAQASVANARWERLQTMGPEKD